LTAIAPRERTTILQSLGAGVVPAVGLHHLQVGRKDEVEALIRDLQIVEDGGAAVRFIVGRYGSGKTFFLNLIRNVALQRKHVVLQADITTDRRLYATGGEARALYTELVRNLSTRARPEGNALPNLVEKWVGEVDHEIREAGGTDDDVRQSIIKRLKSLQDLVSGFDFATVMTKYYEGYLTQNDVLQGHALRWFRGEFTTKTEAREALGVRTIIDDAQVYDYLKLWAGFVRLAGYKGLLVNIDELVVLSHRLSNTTSRNKNYEALLRIINDCLQGRAQGLAFIFAGTDECIEDRRRGLFSYEALATRLASNRFAVDGRQDWSSPIIKLQSLRPEDCFVLLAKLRHIHAGGDPAKYLISDEGITTYLRDCNERMGAAYFQTPRDTVKDFINLLNILDQDRSLSWQTLLSMKSFVSASAQDPETEVAEDDNLSEFQL
jgi:hypothetical protein